MVDCFISVPLVFINRNIQYCCSLTTYNNFWAIFFRCVFIIEIWILLWSNKNFLFLIWIIYSSDIHCNFFATTAWWPGFISELSWLFLGLREPDRHPKILFVQVLAICDRLFIDMIKWLLDFFKCDVFMCCHFMIKARSELILWVQRSWVHFFKGSCLRLSRHNFRQFGALWLLATHLQSRVA